MASEKHLHRIAFRLTLYLIGFSLVPIFAGVFLIPRSPDSVALLVLFVIAILLAVFFAIKRAVIKALPAEGMQIVGRDNVYIDPKNAVWAFTWGMYWRATVTSVVTEAIATALGSAANAGTRLSFVLALIGWYVSALWLFKYQYGQLRVVPSDQPVLIESYDTPKNEGNVMTKISVFFTTVLSFLGMGLLLLFPLGGLYWLWMSFKIGSFWMFALGMFPLTMIPAAIVGAYGLIFGMPSWVYNWFR